MYARIGDIIIAPNVGRCLVIAPDDDAGEYLVYVLASGTYAPGSGTYVRVKARLVIIEYRVYREYTEVILDE